MTKLRERMLQDLQLRGYAERTQQMYTRAVRKLAEHYGKSPDQITEEELRGYFLYVKNNARGGFRPACSAHQGIPRGIDKQGIAFPNAVSASPIGQYLAQNHRSGYNYERCCKANIRISPQALYGRDCRACTGVFGGTQNQCK